VYGKNTRRKIPRATFFYLLLPRKRCLIRARIRRLTFYRNARVRREVAKMSDAVDTLLDGMTISSLTRKDEDDNLDCDARKVHFRGSSICTSGHYAECIAYGSMLADATFILIRLSSASVLPSEIT